VRRVFNLNRETGELFRKEETQNKIALNGQSLGYKDADGRVLIQILGRVVFQVPVSIPLRARVYT
jgi:hypothetical protein